MKNSLQETAAHTGSTWATLIFEIALVGVFFVVLRFVGVPKNASMFSSALFAVALGCSGFVFTYLIYPKFAERKKKVRNKSLQSTATNQTTFKEGILVLLPSTARVFLSILAIFAFIGFLIASLITGNYVLITAILVPIQLLLKLASSSKTILSNLHKVTKNTSTADNQTNHAVNKAK